MIRRQVLTYINRSQNLTPDGIHCHVFHFFFICGEEASSAFFHAEHQEGSNLYHFHIVLGMLGIEPAISRTQKGHYQLSYWGEKIYLNYTVQIILP